MWGLKPSANRRSQRGVDPVNVPGFSKWFANEVYIESKLMDATVEQISLSMMQHNEWINGVMSDVASGNAGAGGLLMLQSPTRLRDSSVSPLKDLQTRELDVLKGTTELVTAVRDADSDEELSESLTGEPQITAATTTMTSRKDTKDVEPPVQNTPDDVIDAEPTVQDEPAVEPTLAAPVLEREEREEDSDSSDSDASFEAISSKIRKSFAAKTLKSMAVEKEKREQEERERLEEEERLALKIEEARRKDRAAAETAAAEASAAAAATAAAAAELKAKEEAGADEKSSKESDDLMLEEEELQLGKLEKIELKDIGMKQTTTSPIKFAELPSREPLKVLATKKKSIRRSTIRKKKQPGAAAASAAAVAATTPGRPASPSPFTAPGSAPGSRSAGRTSRARRASRASRKYKLGIPPMDLRTPGDQQSDEPTIKMNRPVRTPQNKGAVTGGSGGILGEDSAGLFSRLAAPTESSKRKMTPRKSTAAKTATVAAAAAAAAVAPVTIGRSPLIHPDTEREVSRSSPIKARGSPIKPSLKRGVDVEPEQERVPLTQQSLRPPKEEATVKKVETATAGKGLNYRAKSESKRQKLGKMNENHSRLNVPTVQYTSPRPVRKPRMQKAQSQRATAPTTASINEVAKPVNILDGLDALDENLEPKEEQPSTKGVPEWATNAVLDELLRKQQRTDPARIFGAVPKVDCNEIFGRNYFGSLNVRWQEGDKVSEREVERYNREMGFR